MIKDETEEQCEIDDNTTRVQIGLFGFYPHSRFEDLILFFETELWLKNFDRQPIGENFYRTIYEVYSSKETDSAHILGLKFGSKVEAEEFIQNKIRNSRYVNLSLFSDIHYIDGDKFEVFWAEVLQRNLAFQSPQQSPEPKPVPQQEKIQLVKMLAKIWDKISLWIAGIVLVALLLLGFYNIWLMISGFLR